MFYFDPLYLLFALPALLLGLYAQFKVQSAMERYSRLFTSHSGLETARAILEANGLYNVHIEETSGFLSDHYDPVSRTLRLSPSVARGRNVAAMAVAAHEAGHALQHARGYWPLYVRSGMVPAVQFGSWLGPVIFMVGFLFNLRPIAWLGVLLFGAVTLFALVTLPVEYDASRRAKQVLERYFMLDRRSMAAVSDMLNAAALTYVAALLQAISTLLYYVFLLTGFSRDER